MTGVSMYGETGQRESVSRPRVGNLPADLTSFVGRRREVAEIKRLFSASRLVTLTGVGGVGKTRLAVRSAAELQRAFLDGVWMVDLGQLADPALLADTVAATLRISGHSPRPPIAILSDYLEDKRLLLLLDSCEHLLDAGAALAESLLRAAPQLHILATSRQPLGMLGEYALRVPSLTMPETSGPLPPGAALRYESMNLFAERAAAACPGFEVTEQNQVSVAAICHRLDGIPLAIELAAVRLRVLSADQILARLADRYGLLTVGSRSALPRQQTLRATVEWSFDLCSPAERTLWARLSVFTGGFDLDAVEQVCADEELSGQPVLELVASLVDKSILVPEDQGTHVRYRLLETLREYGRERLRELGAESPLRRRHRDYYLRLAERCETEWFGPNQLMWFNVLSGNLPNLRSALDSCLAESDGEAALRIAAALRIHWHASGSLGEGRRWLDRALAQTTDPTPARAKGLWVAGWLALMQGDVAAAEPLLEQGRDLAGRLGDATVLAHVELALAVATMYRGDLPQATAGLTEALARHRVIGDEIGTAIALTQLPLLACLLGDTDRAIAWGEECLAISDARGERWYRAHALWTLSIAEWQRGDRLRATALACDGIRLKLEFKDRLGIARCLEVLAWVAADDRYYRRSARLLGATQAIWQTLGARLSGFGALAEQHDQCCALVREGLGVAAFDAEFDQGLALDLGQAVAYALGEKASVDAPSKRVPASPLTRREREVAELVARGLSNRDIAGKLVISPRTAEAHVEHILTKLGFTSRTQIAAWVSEHRAENSRD